MRALAVHEGLPRFADGRAFWAGEESYPKRFRRDSRRAFDVALSWKGARTTRAASIAVAAIRVPLTEVRSTSSATSRGRGGRALVIARAT